jgi:pyruvate dehydrogenase E2 component (dihydrolipoamide acetyltransferase)
LIAGLANFTLSQSVAPVSAKTTSPASPLPPTPLAHSTTAVSSSPSTTLSPRVFASPLAKKIARERDISLAGITGTGPVGRIIRADVDAALANKNGVVQKAAFAVAAAEKSAAVVNAAPSSSLSSFHADFNDFSLSSKAQAYAAQLAQQKRDVPHYHLTIDITLDTLLTGMLYEYVFHLLVLLHFRLDCNEYYVFYKGIIIITLNTSPRKVECQPSRRREVVSQ